MEWVWLIIGLAAIVGMTVAVNQRGWPKPPNIILINNVIGTVTNGETKPAILDGGLHKG